MEKIEMVCDKCGKASIVHAKDIAEVKAKIPFYRCGNCNIGTLYIK